MVVLGIPTCHGRYSRIPSYKIVQKVQPAPAILACAGCLIQTGERVLSRKFDRDVSQIVKHAAPADPLTTERASLTVTGTCCAHGIRCLMLRNAVLPYFVPLFLLAILHFPKLSPLPAARRAVMK